MSCLFGICFLLYFFKLSAGHGFSCSLNMRILLARIMTPPPPITPWSKNPPVDLARKVRNVLSREHTNREKEIGKYFSIGKSNIHIITILNNKIMSYWIKITAGINSLIFIFSYIDQCPDLHISDCKVECLTEVLIAFVVIIESSFSVPWEAFKVTMRRSLYEQMYVDIALQYSFQKLNIKLLLFRKKHLTIVSFNVRFCNAKIIDKLTKLRTFRIIF
jgi:hypothetical protein